MKEAIRRGVELAAPYPDAACRRLRAALGEFYGVERDEIICGNGAADLIFQLALARRPRRALVTAPSFSEYEQALEVCGAQVRRCALREERGFAFDLEEWMGEAEAWKPDLAFFCNPNNPTGLAERRETVEEMARFCGERGIFLVVDECFGEFWTSRSPAPSWGSWGIFPACLC